MIRLTKMTLSIWIAIACLACGSSVSWAQQVGKRQVTFGDLKSFRDAFGLQLSPDGQNLTYFIGDGDEDSVYGGIWIVSTQPGRKPRRVATGLLPLWSPDGEYLAYYSNDKATNLQLWVLKIATGHTEQVTHLANGIDPDPVTYMAGWIFDALRYSWSPDNRQLVFCSRTTAKGGNTFHLSDTTPSAAGTSGWPLVLTGNTPKEWTMSGVFAHASGGLSQGIERWKNGYPVLTNAIAGQPAEVNQLFTVDVNTKAVRQLTTDDSWYFSPNWSPDGKTIICASYEGRPVVGYGPDTSNIYAIDVMTATKSAVTTGPGAKTMPTWSPDG